MDTRKYEIEKYMELLASKVAVPGGGGASAVVGAMGTCLAMMVCNLSLGKKKFEAIEDKIEEILLQMNKSLDKLLDFADEDAKVFEPLAKAYALPNGSKKDEIIEPLLFEAAKVPLNIMKEAASILENVEYLARNASKLAISDAGVAANNVRACVYSAFLNVKINTKYMKNRNRAKELEKEGESILEEVKFLSDRIYEFVLKEL